MTQPQLFYVDTTILIDALENKSESSEWLSAGLLSPDRQSPHRLLTSALTITETLVVPVRLQSWDMALLYAAWLSAGDVLKVVDVDQPTFYRAAVLRAKYRALKTPDAIHLAAAIANRCDYLVTGDKRLRGTYDDSHARPLFAFEEATELGSRPMPVLTSHLDRETIDALLTQSRP